MHDQVVPHDPSSAGLARRQVVTGLRACSVPEAVVEDAALVISELVGNAVRHGRPLASGGLGTRWSLGPGRVRLEVHEGGCGPRGGVSTPDVDQVSGRGLLLVDALSGSWGVGPFDGGCRVWAELALPVAARA